ncbi:MAG: alpha/beta fold hydrolase [Rhodocyclaceae bacterium]|nr:alpha/beta fold hydrolase [Rhodocyclaceae bacterium]
MGVFMPLLHAQLAWLVHPQELGQKIAESAGHFTALGWHTWRRLVGLPSEDVERPHPDDKRFADPIWSESATWDIVKEWYLAMTHRIQDMLYETPGLSGREARRAAFWWRKWLNAIAPTNFFLTNPVAMRRAFETRGESLLRGWKNFLEDLAAGTIRMTRPEDFQVGVNLATTAGKIVFRNALFELIHYRPLKEVVYATPMLIVPPWINKYYVLDLTPQKSLVRYLLEQGFDVYMISWKNPQASDRELGFDDYLRDGIGEAARVVRAISLSPTLHVTGYCLGGAALATWLAWANRRNEAVAASATFFTTLVDYHKPGDIEVFLDEGSIRYLERMMALRGYLDGKEMAAAFRLLRSNSLIWHYVVHGYLYGESPPPFDVLYWNMDTTRMPARMHAWYLRNFYLANKLIRKDAIVIDGTPIDLSWVTQPIYAVAAVDDHIAPWKEAFRLARHVNGPVRFVLSSSGHVLGIVNPPVTPPKREFWVASAARHEDAEEWLERAEHRPGSWWEDWTSWLATLSAPPAAPRLDSEEYPALDDAPGAYVLAR